MDIFKKITKKVKSINFKEVRKTTYKLIILFFIGFSIYLFISTIMLIFFTKPEKEVKVPDVVGKQFIDVYNSLIRSGIKPELKFRDVFDVDNGIILGQYPKTGEIIPENSNIKLLISRSTFYIEVPNLIGSELPIAINKLKNMQYHGKSISINAGMISYIQSDKNADNIVINQNPKAGEKITPDKKINLLVSSGKLKSDNAMPNVTGQSINLCYDLLQAKGATIQEDIVNTSNIQESGIISAQAPAKGTTIKPNDIIKLTVKWYALKEHPYYAYEKIEYVIPSDQKEGLFEAHIEDNFSKRIRFSRTMKPGQKISFIFDRTGNAKISILNNKKIINTMSIHVEDYD